MAEAADFFAQAFALDPNNPEALYRYAQMQNVMGHVHEALLTYEQLRALEPLVPIYQFQTAGQLYFGGRNQAAIEILEATPDSTPARFYRNLYLARAYAGAGRFAESADALLALRGQPQASAESIEAAAALIRAPRKTGSPASLPDLGDLAFVYAYIGAEDRLFDGAERGVAIGVVGEQMAYWSPAWAPARKTQRFEDLATEVGIVDYSEQLGWPDLCRPQGANDFACD